ncbi:MAG: hypothetical protein V4760_08210 [Bdellovibrionota bacterium]
MRSSLLSLGGFALVFLALFSQFPMTGRLPGNTDSLLALALSNLVLEKIGLFLSGELPFTAMYPARDVMAYGENCYGLAAIFIVFKVLTSSDLVSYYLFITTIFTLNAFAIMKLASHFVRDSGMAALAGLAFSLAGFTLGNIDDPNVVFVFFPALGLLFLLRGIERTDAKSVRTGLLLSGLQIWFGMYFFIYQFLMIAMLVPFHIEELRKLMNRKRTAGFAAAYVGPALPLIALYLYNQKTGEVVSPYEVFADCSMTLANFFRHLPGNLIYPDAGRFLDWVEIRKNAFPGVLLPVLAGIGLVATGLKEKRTRFVAFVMIVFLVLSFGSNIPGLARMRDVPYLSYLRVPSRFYLVTLLMASIFFAIGAEKIATYLKLQKSNVRHAVFAVVVAGLFALENVPFPLFGYEYASLLAPSPSYAGFFREGEEKKIVLDLPSTVRFLPSQSVDSSHRLWFFTREIVYMNWQTYHRQLIVGGANGYVSKARMDVEAAVRRLPESSALAELEKIGVELLVFHKHMVLFPEEDILTTLKEAKGLKMVLENDREAIFEIEI